MTRRISFSRRPWLPAAVAALFMTGLAVSPGAAASVVRYVATSGSDTGDCTSASAPCKTITYALSQSLAGDTIRLAAGTYTEAVTISLDNITIEGADPATTIVNGPDQPCGQGANSVFTTSGHGIVLGAMTIGCAHEAVAVNGGDTIVEGDIFEATTDIGVSMGGGSAGALGSLFLGRAGVCSHGPAGVPMDVLGSTFLTEQVGICVGEADAVIHDNRIVGNTTAGVEVLAGGTADVNDNWWGCNAGPNHGDCDALTGATATSWLQLKLLWPKALAPGASGAVKAEVMTTAAGNAVAVDFPGAPVDFSATNGGSVSPAEGATADGVATTTLKAPSTTGSITVQAVLDYQTVGGAVAILSPTSSPASPRPSTSPTPRPSTSPASSVAVITQPPTDQGPTSTPLGTSSVAAMVVLLATFSSVALAFALPKRRRLRR